MTSLQAYTVHKIQRIYTRVESHKKFIPIMAKDLGDKLEAPSGFDGPGNDKKFTDIVMALAFLAMVAAMTAIGVYAINEGDYRLILYPMDYDGNVCGTNYGNIDMSDYPSLYILNFVGSGVCVKECPR